MSSSRVRLKSRRCTGSGDMPGLCPTRLGARPAQALNEDGSPSLFLKTNHTNRHTNLDETGDSAPPSWGCCRATEGRAGCAGRRAWRQSGAGRAADGGPRQCGAAGKNKRVSTSPPRLARKVGSGVIFEPGGVGMLLV